MKFILVLSVVILLLSACGGSAPQVTPAAPMAGPAIAATAATDSAALTPPGQTLPDEGNNHVPQGAAISYAHVPPASGPHYPAPLRWNKYSTEQPEGNWVHNLEHGGVVMLYNCPTGCTDMVARMNSFYDRQKPDQFGEIKLILMPYARLPQPNKVALLAWDHYLPLPDFDEAQAQRFYTAYADQGPESVP